MHPAWLPSGRLGSTPCSRFAPLWERSEHVPELLRDLGTLEPLQLAAAAMPLAEDPWIWAIERRRRTQECILPGLLTARRKASYRLAACAVPDR